MPTWEDVGYDNVRRHARRLTGVRASRSSKADGTVILVRRAPRPNGVTKLFHCLRLNPPSDNVVVSDTKARKSNKKYVGFWLLIKSCTISSYLMVHLCLYLL